MGCTSLQVEQLGNEWKKLTLRASGAVTLRGAVQAIGSLGTGRAGQTGLRVAAAEDSWSQRGVNGQGLRESRDAKPGAPGYRPALPFQEH